MNCLIMNHDSLAPSLSLCLSYSNSAASNRVPSPTAAVDALEAYTA